MWKSFAVNRYYMQALYFPSKLYLNAAFFFYRLGLFFKCSSATPDIKWFTIAIWSSAASSFILRFSRININIHFWGMRCLVFVHCLSLENRNSYSQIPIECISKEYLKLYGLTWWNAFAYIQTHKMGKRVTIFGSYLLFSVLLLYKCLFDNTRMYPFYMYI